MLDGYFTLYIFLPDALQSNGFHTGEYYFWESILRYITRDSNKANSWYICFNRSSLNFTSSFSTQLLFTHVQLFCDPIDYSLSGPSVNEIFQARLLEWFAIFFSKGSSGPKDWTHSFCIGRQTLYHWATREAHIKSYWGRAIFLNFTVICSDWIGLSQNPDICN